MRQYGGCNNHVAAVVKDNRYRGFTWLRSGERVSAIATFHSTDPDRPASCERRHLASDQIEVAHTIKVVVVCHAGGAVTEAELGTEIDDYCAPAICRFAYEGLTSPPLIHRKRPGHFCPRRWARIVTLVRRSYIAECRKNPVAATSTTIPTIAIASRRSITNFRGPVSCLPGSRAPLQGRAERCRHCSREP
jgi:hypothetical protein